MIRRLTAFALIALWAFCPWSADAATLLPLGEQCFQATSGINGMVGAVGTITGGAGGTTGTYGGVALTGGSGSGATANITVAGGTVTAVAILNPGTQYVVGDALSASAATIGNVTGFSVPVNSVSINSSLAGGTVGFYIPNTNTFKQTWQDAGQAALNTNPVTLDQNGCAVIYGAGTYRQIVKDSLGNTVWDKLTTDTSASNSVFWAGQAGGTPNAITVTDANWNATDGSIITFIPLATNTGATTLSPSSGGPYSIVKDTASGPTALTGGEIVATSPANVVEVIYSATQNNFHILNLVNSAANATPSTSPQGYLTLLPAASGGPIMGTSDITAATTVYYSPYVGNQIPIWNGTAFSIITFPELSLTLSASSQSASTLYDVCIFNNAGTPVAVFGPAWSTSTAGSGNRGTGNGTAQIVRQSGIWVNAVQISANNGSNTYTIPTLQCTYVGTVAIDGTNGQVSAYRTAGQNRKFGVWNAYHRVPIVLQGADSTASWTYQTNTWRPSNNAAANGVTVLTGLPEEFISNTFYQSVQYVCSSGTTCQANMSIGIGWNSTTAPTGLTGINNNVAENSSSAGFTFQTQVPLTASYLAPPTIGLNVATPLENAVRGTSQGGITYEGTTTNMSLQAKWNG